MIKHYSRSSRKHVAVNKAAVQVPLTPIGMTLKQMTSLDSEVEKQWLAEAGFAEALDITGLIHFKFTPIY